ncbi:hypothetical protein GF358_00745 [Candidatus Woesearchaeota archaeon]|nr:hypothetical protein [Candidatus Woesearchaeota archaeon]
MKVWIGICILMSILLVPSVSALIGCCCDPVTLAGTFESDSSCTAKNFTFAGVPSPGQTCSEYCNATQQISPAPPVNVTVPSVGCGTPGFKSPPENLVVSAVKGEKQLQLSFSLPCPADYVEIYRCKGSACSDFVFRDTSLNSLYYVDKSGLEFDSDYRYKIVAHYSQGSDSDPAFAVGNVGDLECWHKKSDNEFCVHEFYYESFRDYLELYGYGNKLASEFDNNFDSAVRSVFASKFNKAWACNADNILFQKVGAVSCSSGQLCVVDSSGPSCITPGACEQGGDFGLFSSKSSCESQDYCFFDQSKTNVDFCFECSPRMNCFDYHSESACTSDACGIGDCEWRDVFSSIGVGVCIDKRFDNCPRCAQTPVTSIANHESYSSVFDACSPAKAEALSTGDNPCFFNKNNLLAASCSEAVCVDFSKSQCGSPEEGIKLGSDNTITTRSSDACDIGACYYSEETNHCFKDADGNQISDCDERVCERDFFPPETSVFVSRPSGKDDYLNIKINDKTYADDVGSDKTGLPGYLTFVCVGSCSDTSSFILVNSSRLNLNDLELKDGRDIIATLVSGKNTLKFFSVDPNRNVEVVRSVDFFACDNCAGPKILRFVVSNSNFINGNYYTTEDSPVINVVFNEPAELTAVGLARGAETFDFTAEPSSGFNYEYTLTGSDLVDGKYLFALNAKDENGLFMDIPLNYNFTVDTVPPVVGLNPESGSFFDEGNVEVSISASEPILLNASVDDVIFVNNYVAKKIPTSIESLLTSTDNKLFTGEVKGLSAGKKALSVLASDFAGNEVEKESFFFISTGAPDFRLKSPSFGVSSVYEFDAVVETNTRAECRYLYNIPSPPPSSEFAYLSRFSITGDTEHTLKNVKIPEDNKSVHLLHVYCKAEGFAPVRKTFEFKIDTARPNITTAFVYPDVISDYIGPEDLRFMVELKVQTSEPTFCRYSESTKVFDEMENEFPGFGVDLKRSHVINVTVEEEGEHVYYVACEDVAELKTDSVPLDFLIDTSVPFMIESVTDSYQNSSPLFLRVESNKHAFCYYGEDENDISTCFGDCIFGFAHVARIEKQSEGDYQFFVRCNNGAGGMTTDVLPVEIDFGIGPEVNISVVEHHCEDNILNGTETDIDCGGACSGCAKGLNCVVDSDCAETLFCVKGVCSEKDTDEDGVIDINDNCPDTPADELVDSRGCSKSQRDSDNDGMDDDWELKYGLDPDDSGDAEKDRDSDGLSNLEEFGYGTDPTNKDSDSDKWSDGKEVDEGFDPLNPDSHPESILPAVLWILFAIIMIVGAGIGGYIVYIRYGDKLKEFFARKPEPEARSVAPSSVSPPVDKFRGLRKMVKIGPPRKPKEKGWISLKNLKQRIKKKGPPDVWEKMQKLKTPVEKKPVAPARPKPEQEETLDKLRKIAKRKKKNE